MMRVLVNVVRTERLLGLWKGVTPSFMRTIPAVGLYFSTYYQSKQHFFQGKSPGALGSVLLGGGARTVAGVLMLPVTVIKTRYECGRYRYVSVPRALRSVWRTEGPVALYSGLMATLLRDVPFSGIYVMCYSQMKTNLPNEINVSAFAPLANFSCGILAGVSASLVTQPADVVKTLVQVNPQLRTTDAVKYIYAEHGFQGFLRGAVPRCLRRTMISAMAWTVYEQMMAYIGLKS
ncbi:mitochondrial glycine transporter A-like isoform X1 [Phycodurus eques]|uniref:mitochondrial glycine transporter A-like isoform X1 n=2 Tax=Phycodurus eques TaxID=693459 RepID=UPI002ACDE639|nr:mitochondrial glycine transporter A-like isoform X1 [Phycodurus eques]XP_061557411.1 mitochondrial glycine transporter A-like isoform X1 [Phycodurus eques]XP_061557412.1 mitochondrial glycine transporter A-like isoform X1 [Phycodurus eques]